MMPSFAPFILTQENKFFLYTYLQNSYLKKHTSKSEAFEKGKNGWCVPTESDNEERNNQSNGQIEDKEKEGRTVAEKEEVRASTELYNFVYHYLKCIQYVNWFLPNKSYLKIILISDIFILCLNYFIK